MKSFLLVLLVFGFAATAYTQTTREEYNYIIKGYKTQIEGGLDMKKGYSFEDLATIVTEDGGTDRRMEMKALRKEGKADPCAIMLIYSNSDGVANIYFCIPHPLSDQSIWELYFKSLDNLQASALKSILYAVSHVTAYYSPKK